MYDQYAFLICFVWFALFSVVTFVWTWPVQFCVQFALFLMSLTISCVTHGNSALLKLSTRDPRLDPFQGFSIWYFCIPGKDTNINKEILFSTIKKYCLWYNAITKLYLDSIYYICLNGWVLFLTISLVKVRFPPIFGWFYDNHILLYTFEKIRWNLNARKIILKMCRKVVKSNCLLFCTNLNY